MMPKDWREHENIYRMEMHAIDSGVSLQELECVWEKMRELSLIKNIK